MDFQSEKSMSKIDHIHLRAVILCMSKKSKMGKLRLRAFQPYHPILCILKHVEDVEDRSNAPKGCNAMYVEDVEDGKRTYRHIYAHNFLNIQPIFNPQKVLES